MVNKGSHVDQAKVTNKATINFKTTDGSLIEVIMFTEGQMKQWPLSPTCFLNR